MRHDQDRTRPPAAIIATITICAVVALIGTAATISLLTAQDPTTKAPSTPATAAVTTITTPTPQPATQAEMDRLARSLVDQVARNFDQVDAGSIACDQGAQAPRSTRIARCTWTDIRATGVNGVEVHTDRQAADDRVDAILRPPVVADTDPAYAERITSPDSRTHVVAYGAAQLTPTQWSEVLGSVRAGVRA
jgi:hypothetical protein